MRSVIILGAGGHARVLSEILRLNNANVIGCVAPQLPAIEIPGVPFLGADHRINEYSSQEVALVNGIGSIGNSSVRRKVFDQFAQLGYSFATVIHPSAVVGSGIQLGEGVQLMAGAIVQTGSLIGDNAIVNTGAQVDHDCQVGADVHIAPGAVVCGGVRIGRGSHIGAGAVIMHGIEIGAHVLVGVGAAVVRDVPSAVVAVGVPAKWTESEQS